MAAAKKKTTKTTKTKKAATPDPVTPRIQLLSVYLEPKFDKAGGVTPQSGFHIGVERLKHPTVKRDRRSLEESGVSLDKWWKQQYRAKAVTSLARILTGGMAASKPSRVPLHLANGGSTVSETELQVAIGKAIIEVLDTFYAGTVGDSAQYRLLDLTQLQRHAKPEKATTATKQSAKTDDAAPPSRLISFDDE